MKNQKLEFNEEKKANIEEVKELVERIVEKLKGFEDKSRTVLTRIAMSNILAESDLSILEIYGILDTLRVEIDNNITDRTQKRSRDNSERCTAYG